MQDVNGLSHLNSPTKIFIRINNLDKMTIENDKIIVDENMSVNGNIAVNTLSLNSTFLNVNYARLGGLPGGAEDQATFMNKDQYFPNESLDE